MPNLPTTYEGFLYAQPTTDGQSVHLYTFQNALMEPYGYTLLQPVSIPVTWPEGFSPTAAAVANIERQKAEALTAYQKTVEDCNIRLQSLLALEG
jgi:hypothetical protein